MFKTLLISGLSLGFVAAPVAGVALSGPTYKSGEGYWIGRTVYIIAKSFSGNVKLFAEEEEKMIPEESSSGNKTYKINAFYNGKEVKGDLSLCSPNNNKTNFYLLFKPTGDFWVRKLDGGDVICEVQREDSKSLGERLSLRTEVIPENNQLPSIT